MKPCLKVIMFSHLFLTSPFLVCPTGFLNRVLSWQGFLVSTRLSYALYLTQFPVFFYFVGKNRVIHTYDIFLLVSFE